MTKDEFIKLVNANIQPYYIPRFMKFKDDLKHCEMLIKDKFGYAVCFFEVCYNNNEIFIFNGQNLGNINGLVRCFNSLNKLKLED